MTAGEEGGEDEGSDSMPSEDNLDEDELAQIVPLPKKKEEPEIPAKVSPVKTKKVSEQIKIE
jgi:hypothetical protein